MYVWKSMEMQEATATIQVDTTTLYDGFGWGAVRRESIGDPSTPISPDVQQLRDQRQRPHAR